MDELIKKQFSLLELFRYASSIFNVEKIEETVLKQYYTNDDVLIVKE